MTDIAKPDDNLETPPTDEIQAPEEQLEAPLLEPETPPVPDPKVHPLAPGGRRFEQVYAKGKQAEREAQDLRERLAAAEGKLEALIKPASQPSADKEYTWAELETFIQQGRITRADAEAHREEILTKKLTQKVKGDFQAESRQQTREQSLTQTIQAYVQAVPAITEEGSADRVRLDEEFDWLASAQGLDPAKVEGVQRRAIQAAALRAVYGPVDSLLKRNVPARVDRSEGVSGGVRPSQVKNPDQVLLDGLTKVEVTHYKHMMTKGRYPGGWKDVVAELKFDPKNRKRK